MFRRKLPGEGKGPRASVGSILKVAPQWLTQQVIQGGSIPSALGGDKVVPVLDVYQNGWGVATVAADFINHGAGTAQTTYNVYSRFGIADADLGLYTARIVGAMVVSSIVAAGSIVIFQAISPNNPGYQIARLTMAASPFIAATKDIFGDANPRILPGYRLEVTIPATGGGEVVTVNVALAISVAGFSLPY